MRDFHIRNWRVLAAAVLAVLAIGIALHLSGAFGPRAARPGAHEHEHGPGAETAPASAPAVQQWTCSMHPQIRRDRPGQCPICGMNLVPVVVSTQSREHPRRLTLAPGAAVIQTVPVERRLVTAEVRMVGLIDYDESRLASITARFPGRLDRLFVDHTGVSVRKGDHLASIYSPDLLAAQEELLQALRASKEAPGVAAETARANLLAVRDKLRLWDLTEEQIQEIEKRGRGEDHLTLYAPVGGVVIRKDAMIGSYVQTGSPLYAIADLSRVWVKLDAYESDLTWLRLGQPVHIEAEAYPGRDFVGTIAFIDPVVTDMTRTVKVRVNVDNPQRVLKPQMFVRAVVASRVADDGAVVEESLAGKWMCPMHPEVVKDAPGACDICGMALERTESLGYAPADAAKVGKPLVVPAAAVLLTGTRGIVYVEMPGEGGGRTFEGRQIVLGPRAGGWYLVREGLREGERVAERGSFLIDSELQIRAQPSMMSPEGGTPAAGGHVHE